MIMAEDESEDEEWWRKRERQFQCDEEPVDRSPSSTAVDPEHAAQDNSTELRTGRHDYTPNETFIGGELPAARDDDNRWADEDPEEVSSYASLNQANRRITTDGENDPRSEQIQLDYENDIQTWGQHVGLTSHEISVVKRLFQRVDETLREGYNSETVILAALTIVANEDDRTRQTKVIREDVTPIAEDPTTPAVCHNGMVENYEDLRKQLNITKRAIRACREHLQQKL